MVSFNLALVASLVATTAVAAPAQTVQTRSFSGKRGLCYNNPQAIEPFKNTAANSWRYNWGSKPDTSSTSDYVPMLWGSKFFDTWKTSSTSILDSGYKFLLGFNEPDQHDQAFMSPGSAVDAFKSLLTPLADKVSLGSPAVTNGGGEMGLTWMKNFLDNCGGSCGLKFLAVHWYSPAEEIEGFKNHINKAIQLAKDHGIDQVWITEFKGLGDSDAQVKFINAVLPWLDANDGVARYSYFMADTLVQGGQLSPVGQAYATA